MYIVFIYGSSTFGTESCECRRIHPGTYAWGEKYNKFLDINTKNITKKTITAVEIRDIYKIYTVWNQIKMGTQRMRKRKESEKKKTEIKKKYTYRCAWCAFLDAHFLQTGGSVKNAKNAHLSASNRHFKALSMRI